MVVVHRDAPGRIGVAVAWREEHVPLDWHIHVEREIWFVSVWMVRCGWWCFLIWQKASCASHKLAHLALEVYLHSIGA
jgi:hypothetical protein